MKLEHQFTTIEQSKKLVELGIDSNLAKFWHVSVTKTIDTDFDKAEFQTVQYIVAKTDAIYDISIHIAPAFSMAEVLKMMGLCFHDINISDSVYEQVESLIRAIRGTTWFDLIGDINKALQD